VLKEKRGKMKIEIKKRDGIYLAIIGVLVLIVLRIFSFNSDNHMNNRTYGERNDHMGKGMNQNGATNLSGNEFMFAEMMIPHHQQAVDMSDLALTTSKNSKILDLAKRIKEAQSAEIIQMQSWLGTNGGNQMMNDHMGHQMGGMLSEEEISNLKSSSGSTFDRWFLEGMIAHHEGALHMVLMIKETGNQEVNSFGLNVTKVQTAEITEMKEILASLS
jgi:uncharacterized protein (DUF305 family)